MMNDRGPRSSASPSRRRPTSGPVVALWLLFAVCAIAGCEPQDASKATGRDLENGSTVSTPIVAPPPIHAKKSAPAVIDQTLAARIDAVRLRRAIRAAADYLIRSCDEQGKFAYLVNLDPKVKVTPSYNIVRHAGAMYALGAYDRWHSDDRTRQAMRRAAGYIERHALAPMPGDKTMLGIWSFKSVEGAEPVPVVRLGNIGLGLVGFASLQKALPEAATLETSRGLGRFVVFMQKSGGAFFPTYDADDGGRCDKWYCEYYPGEAILGLVKLYEIDPDPRWRQAAADGIFALAWQRRNETHPLADHWALLATAGLFKVTDEDAMRFPRGLWRRHAEAICRGILADYDAPEKTKRTGDLSRDGYLCRTSVRLEGLTAALTFLQDEELKRRISLAIAEGIGFLLDAQIRGGTCDGAFPCLAPGCAGDPAHSDRAEATEVRVDYVQHALNAMVQCAELTGVRSMVTQGRAD